ncbi:GNAT family N-acetyltransferase [Actinoplanes friuliensis]|uniref:GCN5-related N-acetyltransferase n=1 Tax=Actinoplanes friuliensis DSM 7358 TaxID=1246995 RepID=U5VRL7_9ACTN|nr:GNAT family N-acetyltransferase [Actinoplanes friuliensis]AGZ38301.1 GCN5-related N-acetyltransferase [Actinoplanes friuliensis DSM 7358]
MTRLERLDERHADELLRFERENRAFFARSIPDRGDDYFVSFAERHAALLTEQASGVIQFHVMVDDNGAVLGRFNLIDLVDGQAELGFRVAEHATGRGLATAGVQEILVLARDDYGLDRLEASATLGNAGSLGVLRRTGFVAVGEVVLNGLPGLRHVRDLEER